MSIEWRGHTLNALRTVATEVNGHHLTATSVINDDAHEILAKISNSTGH